MFYRKQSSSLGGPPRQSMAHRSAVLDVGHGTVLLDVHVQPVRNEVLGDHHAGLDDARLLGQVPLAEGLRRRWC